MLDPEEVLVRFLQRVLLWLEENHARIINLFRKIDSDNDNMLSREDFFIGMRMMDVSKIILVKYLLCKYQNLIGTSSTSL